MPSLLIRISTILEGFVKLCEVIEDGVELMGYTAWGCIDVSASSGEMCKRSGFIYVYKHDDGSGTLEGKKKKLFYWYQKVTESNGEQLVS